MLFSSLQCLKIDGRWEVYRLPKGSQKRIGEGGNKESSSSSSSDAKRSAEASRRCDCSPERSLLR